MSKIKRIKLTNYLGIEAADVELGKHINVLSGVNGSGKTSIIDGIRTVYENKKMRTKMIKKGTEEATLLVEQDNNISIDRKLRTEGSDYIGMRKDGKLTKTTEGLIRELFSSYIFRPIEWVTELSALEQTESILKLMSIPWEEENFEEWFGEFPKPNEKDKINRINYNQHILLILKEIEQLYYDRRTEINREIRNKEAIREEILQGLPKGYEGEKWENVQLKELYARLNALQEEKRKIETAIDFTNNFKDKLSAIELKYGKEIEKMSKEYDERIELQEFKENKSKEIILDTKNEIERVPLLKENKMNEVQNKHNTELQRLKEEYERKVKLQKENFEKETSEVEEEFEKREKSLKSIISDEEENIKEYNRQVEKLSEKKKNEKELLEKDMQNEKDKFSNSLESQEEYAQKEIPNQGIQLLETQIEKTEEMKEYLREWRKLVTVKNAIEELEEVSNELTKKVEKARILPKELFANTDCPIDGLSLDEEGILLVNELPVDNMSEGEQLMFATSIAKWYSTKQGLEGKLEAILLDGFEKLDPLNQEKVLKDVKNYQVIVTMPSAEPNLSLETLEPEEVDGHFNKIKE